AATGLGAGAARGGATGAGGAAGAGVGASGTRKLAPQAGHIASRPADVSGTRPLRPHDGQITLIGMGHPGLRRRAIRILEMATQSYSTLSLTNGPVNEMSSGGIALHAC